MRRLGPSASAGWRLSQATARLACFFGFGIKIFKQYKKKETILLT